MNEQGNRPRDNQRSKVYASERACHSWSTKEMTLDGCRTYIADILASSWWQHRSAIRRLNVKDGRGTRTAYAGPGVINLPKWSRKEMVILHELSHHLTDNQYAWHGPEFASNMLAIVKQFMGQEAAEELKVSFKNHRVKTRSVLKVTVQKVRCEQCHKVVTKRSAYSWGVSGYGHYYFCTKAHGVIWSQSKLEKLSP